MARKLNNNLKRELLFGKYSRILEYVKRDPELTIEVRMNSEAKIYYKKCLILTISSNHEPKKLAEGYYKKTILPKPTLDLNNPDKYFKESKQLVLIKGKYGEFTIQQSIADSNKTKNNKYFIVDMEYAIPQGKIKKEDRLPYSRIDLVGIDNENNNIILFELKYGSGALAGDSGVRDHYEKMNKLLENDYFHNTIKQDVKNIIQDKIDLGLIDYSLPKSLNDIKMMFIYAYNSDEELKEYKELYSKEIENVETIYIDTRYILK